MNSDNESIPIIKLSVRENRKEKMIPLTGKYTICGEHFVIHHRITDWQKQEYDKKFWTLSHIPSGRAIATFKKTKKECKQIVDNLLKIKGIDWGEKSLNPASKVYEQIKAVIKGGAQGKSFEEMLKDRHES